MSEQTVYLLTEEDTSVRNPLKTTRFWRGGEGTRTRVEFLAFLARRREVSLDVAIEHLRAQNYDDRIHRWMGFGAILNRSVEVLCERYLATQTGALRLSTPKVSFEDWLVGESLLHLLGNEEYNALRKWWNRLRFTPSELIHHFPLVLSDNFLIEPGRLHLNEDFVFERIRE